MPLAVTTALLDLDGTLVDSNDAHAKAWVEVLAEFGHTVTFKDARAAIGEGADKLLPQLVGVLPRTREAKAITERRAELFRERYLATLQPFPFAHELLERMHASGLRLVAATSAKQEEMEALVRLLGAEKLLHDAATSTDARRSKPDPDIVEAALKRAGCTRGEAIMLGDTPYDVAAAKRSEVACVAFRCGGWGDLALRGAVAVYDGPGDLLDRFDGSPLHPATVVPAPTV